MVPAVRRKSEAEWPVPRGSSNLIDETQTPIVKPAAGYPLSPSQEESKRLNTIFDVNVLQLCLVLSTRYARRLPFTHATRDSMLEAPDPILKSALKYVPELTRFLQRSDQTGPDNL